MFSHVTIGSNNIEVSRKFYGPVLGAIGQEEFVRFDDDATAYGDENGAHVWVLSPADEQPSTVGNGMMIAFLSPNRASVDAAYACALENGGSDEGEPGIREDYHANFYAAYLRDPDGNKLCIVCHNPE